MIQSLDMLYRKASQARRQNQISELARLKRVVKYFYFSGKISDGQFTRFRRYVNRAYQIVLLIAAKQLAGIPESERVKVIPERSYTVDQPRLNQSLGENWPKVQR